MNVEDPDYSSYIGLRHLNPEMIRSLRLGLANGADPKKFVSKMKRERLKQKDSEVNVRLVDAALGAIRFMVRNPDAGIIRWTEGEQYVFVEMEERKGLMLCCMRTAERYGDSQRGKIPKGTTITCNKCGQEIESLGGHAWKAK